MFLKNRSVKIPDILYFGGETICGIAGYIGKSKNFKVSYELITDLFDHLETRGIDATGIWGVEGNENARVIYHKEPIRSSHFIKKSMWKKVKKFKPDLLLCHARATSPGIGHASTNSNNHPFVSTDKKIGMIHNGRVSEFDFLKDKYEIKSKTDSEVLLRMYEEGIDYNEPDSWIENVDENVCHRMHGIKEMWSVINHGAMAVAFGERIDEFKRYLFLFHNEHRPLWIADTRDELGQIFFFSSPEIWYKALASNKKLKEMFLGKNSLIEIPVGQVFFFEITKEKPHINSFLRFDIKKSQDKVEKWKKGDHIPIQYLEADYEVLTELDENENIKSKGGKRRTLPSTYVNYNPDNYGEDPFRFSLYSGSEHEELCKEVATLATQIKTNVSNDIKQKNIDLNRYQRVVNLLETTVQYLDLLVK